MEVESAAVALPSRDSQTSASARVSRRDPERHQEKFSAVPLSLKQRSEKTRDPQHCTASSISKTSSPPLTVHGVLLYSLQTARVLHEWVLPQHMCLSQLTSLCRSAQSPRKQQETTVHYHKSFGTFSLYGVLTNGGQPCNVREIHT